jgi:hypothetical protein
VIAKKKASRWMDSLNGKGSANGFVALAMLASPLERRKPDPAKGPPCHLCTARCCKYFALEIDKPTSLSEYDQIRWFLMHEGIAVWVQDGDWYLEVRTVCRHLQPDNSCGIYEKRPQTCKDYGMPEEGPCEFFTDHLKYDHYWDSDEAFEGFIDEQKAKRARQNTKRRAQRARQAASA